MPKLPSLNALRAFEAAARHLSFTRAARELHVTQAAVSHQVKLLEDSLGIALFRRLNRALLLTDAGQVYAPEVKAAFEQIRLATDRIQQTSTDGPVTVTALPSFSARWLVPRLGRFRQQHPDIELLIDPQTQLVDLHHSSADIAIRYGSGHYPGLATERFFTEDLFPVCSPALLNSGLHPLHRPEDLIHHHILHGDGHSDWRTWLKAARVLGVDPNKGTVFTDSGMLIQAALSGQGVAMARGVLVNDELESGALVRPFDLSLPAEYAYYVLVLPERLHVPGVAKFRAWLLAEAARTRLGKAGT